MAQIVVYNRTGIETRFVAFRFLAWLRGVRPATWKERDREGEREG